MAGAAGIAALGEPWSKVRVGAEKNPDVVKVMIGGLVEGRHDRLRTFSGVAAAKSRAVILV